MPFRSAKQREYLKRVHPDVYARWKAEHGTRVVKGFNPMMGSRALRVGDAVERSPYLTGSAMLRAGLRKRKGGAAMYRGGAKLVSLDASGTKLGHRAAKLHNLEDAISAGSFGKGVGGVGRTLARDAVDLVPGVGRLGRRGELRRVADKRAMERNVEDFVARERLRKSLPAAVRSRPLHTDIMGLRRGKHIEGRRQARAIARGEVKQLRAPKTGKRIPKPSSMGMEYDLGYRGQLRRLENMAKADDWRQGAGAALAGTGAAAAGAGLVAGGIPGTTANTKPLERAKPVWNEKKQKYTPGKPMGWKGRWQTGRAGILGFRDEAHRLELKHQKKRVKEKPLATQNMGDRWASGNSQGSLKPEKVVIRELKAGRKIAHGALGAGLAGVAGGAYLMSDRRVRKDQRSVDRYHGAVAGVGAGTAAAGFGASRVLREKGRVWARQGQRDFDRAAKLVPELKHTFRNSGGKAGGDVYGNYGGIVDREISRRAIKTRDKAVAAGAENNDDLWNQHREKHRGKVQADMDRASVLRGSASKGRYFGRTYLGHAKMLRGVGYGGAGLAALGAGGYAMNQKVAKGVPKQLKRLAAELDPADKSDQARWIRERAKAHYSGRGWHPGSTAAQAFPDTKGSVLGVEARDAARSRLKRMETSPSAGRLKQADWRKKRVARQKQVAAGNPPPPTRHKPVPPPPPPNWWGRNKGRVYTGAGVGVAGGAGYAGYLAAR